MKFSTIINEYPGNLPTNIARFQFYIKKKYKKTFQFKEIYIEITMFKCTHCDKAAYKREYHYKQHLLNVHNFTNQVEPKITDIPRIQAAYEILSIQSEISLESEIIQETQIAIQQQTFDQLKNEQQIDTFRMDARAKQLIQDFADDKLNFGLITMFSKLSQIFKIDLNYKRIKDNSFQYNASAIISFDQQYKHKFIPLVLEIDFDSFYTNSLLHLKGQVDDNIWRFVYILKRYREYFQNNNQQKYQKVTKTLACAFIGCLGSRQDNCQRIRDLYAHSLIMQQSRAFFMQLVKVIESHKKHAFFRQTDACFCIIEQEEDALPIYQQAQKILPCKFIIHKNFYHFKQIHRYVSLVNNKPLFKDFSKNCDWFGEYVHKFINDQDPSQFIKACENPLILDNQPLLDAVSRTIQQFPELINSLSDTILLRIEYLDKDNFIRRFTLFTKPDIIDQIYTQYKEKYNNLVAFHEIFIRDNNSLVFDIDIREDVDIDEIIDKLRDFINNHQLIKLLFQIPRCQIAYYKVQNKTSAHIKFDIQLPMQVQKEIAIQCKNQICNEIDIQIYNVGKSIRIPGCSNIKKQLSKEQMIQQTLQLQTSHHLQDYLITSNQQQTISDKYLYKCITENQNAFPYEYKYTIENQDLIQSIIQQQLGIHGISVSNVSFVRQNIGEIDILDNQQDCVICQRFHEKKTSREKLRFIVNNYNLLKILCFHHSDNPRDLSVKIDRYVINQEIDIRDDQLTNARIINQRYMMQKNAKYILPSYQIDIIRSPMGSGKSELFHSTFTQFKKTLMVSCRKIYTLQNLLRFNLTEDDIYWNQSNIDKTSICQVESLSKVDQNAKYDCIILDEFMSILQQLFREDKSVSVRYCQTLINILKKCQRIIVSDATICQTVVDFFTYHFPNFKINVVDNIYKLYSNNTIKIYRDFSTKRSNNYIINKIATRFNEGKKTWAIISQKSEGLFIGEQLARLIPDAVIKIFNGDQDSIEVDKLYIPDNQQRQIINNIKLFKDEQAFEKIDIVICNASITSGLNVADEKFDYVICKIHTSQFSPQQLVQALHRARHTKDIELFTESLQLQNFKTTFYDQFLKGISQDSDISMIDASEKLYYLAKQYTDDINTTGIHYVIHQLKNMGYTVLDNQNFDYEEENTNKTKKQEKTKDILEEEDKTPILTAFMKFIPDFETNSNLLQDILEQYQDEPRDDCYIFKQFLDLARYQVFAQKDSDGYHEMFKEQNFNHNPQTYTDVLKHYLVIHGDLNIDFGFFESNEYQFEKLLNFVVQYERIQQEHGKIFLKQFLTESNKNSKIAKLLKVFIESDDFNDKKKRYSFYRDVLQVNYKSEMNTDKLIQLIVKDKLFEHKKDKLEELLNSDVYESISRSKAIVANYLGYYSVCKQVRLEKQRIYKTFLYDINYIPELPDL